MGADGDDEWVPKPCAGLADTFFSDDPADQEVAKSICRGCSHGVECAELALQAIANGETGGVWVGVTLAELKEQLQGVDRKRARAAGHPSSDGDPDALPGVCREPGHELRDVRAVPPGPDASSRA